MHLLQSLEMQQPAGGIIQLPRAFNLSLAMEEHASTLHFSHFSRLIDSAEASATQGYLTQAKFSLFTNNTVAEGTFYRGTSSNKCLFKLVFRLKQLELSY